MPKVSLRDTFDDPELLAHAGLLQSDPQYLLSPDEQAAVLPLIGKPLLHEWIQREFLRASRFPCLECYFKLANNVALRPKPQTDYFLGLTLPSFAFQDGASLENWIKTHIASDSNVEIGASDNPFLIQNNTIYVDHSVVDLEDTKNIALQKGITQGQFLLRNPLIESLGLAQQNVQNIVWKNFCFASASDEQIAYMFQQFKSLLKPGGRVYLILVRSPYATEIRKPNSLFDILSHVGNIYQVVHQVARKSDLLTTLLFSTDLDEAAIVLHEEEIPGAQPPVYPRDMFDGFDFDFRA